jgi:conjugative transfer signal peptidase TraF
VVAIAGDRVSGTDDGISINGRLIANSKNMGRDGLGQPLPSPGSSNSVVAKGEVWVISSYNPLSFDSRYFGPIPISRIEGLVHPLFVFHPLRYP